MREPDTLRFRVAVVKLAQTHTQWLAPGHCLEALPREESRAIGREVRVATPAEAKAAIDRFGASPTSRSPITESPLD